MSRLLSPLSYGAGGTIVRVSVPARRGPSGATVRPTDSNCFF